MSSCDNIEHKIGVFLNHLDKDEREKLLSLMKDLKKEDKAILKSFKLEVDRINNQKESSMERTYRY